MEMPRMRWRGSILTLVLAFSSLPSAEASVGDSSPVYRECTYKCGEALDCPVPFFSNVAWAHGECFWCRYECLWQAVAVFERMGFGIPQFHGKWPFVATIWAQEPASTLFSLANLLAVNEMRRRLGRIGNLELRGVWTVYTWVGIVTWFCSAWFHATDHWTSERADYFSAFAFVLYALFAALLFVFQRLRKPAIMYSVALCLFLFYAVHIRGLLIHFHYGYNMAVCIGCSVCTLLCYLWYLAGRWARFGGLSGFRQSDRTLLLLLTWTVASVSLELMDFVPLWYIVDAHALFHAATIPVPLFTAQFLLQKYEESMGDYKRII